MLIEDVENLNRPKVRPNKMKAWSESFIHNLKSGDILIVGILSNPVLKAEVSNGLALIHCDIQIILLLELNASIPEIKVSEIVIDGVFELGVAGFVCHSFNDIEVGKEQGVGIIGILRH